jgi:hypothetical protein
MYTPWFKSKTLRIAIVQGILGILAAIVVSNPELKAVGGLAVLKAILDAWLRYQTETPIL